MVFVNSTLRRHRVRLFVYLLNKNTNISVGFSPSTLVSATPQTHIVHGTRLLVLTGFTLTVIHVWKCHRENPKIPKEITFTNWRFVAVSVRVHVTADNSSFSMFLNE